MHCENCKRNVDKLHTVMWYDHQVRKLCTTCNEREEMKFMRKYGVVDLYLWYEVKDVKATPASTTSIRMNVPVGVGMWTSNDYVFPVIAWNTGKHNICGDRIDVWFRFDGEIWHGWNVGNHDIVRCKRTKKTKL